MSLRDVTVPALTATLESITVLVWKVGVGDTVSEGQPIAEVSTDKVDMDLESPFAGTVVELLVMVGESVERGAPVARIETEAIDLLAGLDLEVSEVVAQTETVAETAPTPVRTSTIVPASPPARALARRLGVDLRSVTPTGARGQVTPLDVEQAARGPVPLSAQIGPGTVDGARLLANRLATARIMSESAAIPQFTLWRTVELDRVDQTRHGVGWTTIWVRAMAAALRAHPELNVRWSDKGPVPVDTVAVGLAIDRPGEGLLVASVTDPDLGPIEAADSRIRDVVARAKSGRLRPEDLGQASITISNLGGLGVDRFNALITPPQATILSVGSIKRRPTVTPDGGLVAALTAEIGLTVDHRVADGADGARFLQTLVELLG